MVFLLIRMVLLCFFRRGYFFKGVNVRVLAGGVLTVGIVIQLLVV